MVIVMCGFMGSVNGQDSIKIETPLNQLSFQTFFESSDSTQINRSDMLKNMPSGLSTAFFCKMEHQFEKKSMTRKYFRTLIYTHVYTNVYTHAYTYVNTHVFT